MSNKGQKHDDATRESISESMRLYHALKTPEQKAVTSQKLSDCQIGQLWIAKGPRRGGHFGCTRKPKMDPNTPVGKTTLAKIEKASVHRIIKDLVGTQPELIKDAIIAGLLAPPPRSFPYIALAAAYLDGKPAQAEPVSQPIVDLSELTRDQLAERAHRLARLLLPASDEPANPTGLRVIDATIVPQPTEPEPERSLQELQADVVRAQEEVKRAEEEVRVANLVLKLSKGVNR